MEELVGPDGCHQAEHEKRDLRISPSRAKDSADDEPGTVHGLGAEEDPGKADEEKDARLLHEARHLFTKPIGAFQLARCHQTQPVKRSPHKERPCRAMPQPGNNEGGQ